MKGGRKMKRIETLAMEMALLEGKEQGIKEVDRKLSKIFDKYREDLSPQSANMVNDIVTMLHQLRLQYQHEINQNIINVGALLNNDEEEKEEQDVEKEIKDLISKIMGGNQ